MRGANAVSVNTKGRKQNKNALKRKRESRFLAEMRKMKEKPRGVEKYRMGKKHDKRRKLTDAEREEIKQLHKDGVAIREIHRRFEDKCSRRLIQFIIFPERSERVAYYRYKVRNWKDYYDKEAHRKATQKHRERKRELIKKGIKLKDITK